MADLCSSLPNIIDDIEYTSKFNDELVCTTKYAVNCAEPAYIPETYAFYRSSKWVDNNAYKDLYHDYPDHTLCVYKKRVDTLS